MDALFVDAHPGAPAGHGALLAGALVASGANVAYFANERAPLDLVGDPPPQQVRFVLQQGWATAAAPQRVAADQIDALLAADTPPMLICSDGPILQAASLPAALRDYPGDRLWINCVPETPAGAAAQPLALASLHPVMLQPDEVEMASPQPLLVLARRRRGFGAGRRPRTAGAHWRRLQRAWRAWGITVTERAELLPLLNAVALQELIELPAAMCNTTMETFLADAAGAELGARLVREGMSVVRRERRPLDRLPHDDPQQLIEATSHAGGSHAAALRAARRGEQATADPRASAPTRAFGRVLQAFLLGRAPVPPSANELLLTEASRKGLNLTWNAHVVQRSRRILKLGFFASPAALLEAVT